MGEYVQSSEGGKVMYIDADKLDRWAKTQYLPFTDIKFDGSV